MSDNTGNHTHRKAGHRLARLVLFVAVCVTTVLYFWPQGSLGKACLMLEQARVSPCPTERPAQPLAYVQHIGDILGDAQPDPIDGVSFHVRRHAAANLICCEVEATDEKQAASLARQWAKKSYEHLLIKRTQALAGMAVAAQACMGERLFKVQMGETSRTERRAPRAALLVLTALAGIFWLRRTDDD